MTARDDKETAEETRGDTLHVPAAETAGPKPVDLSTEQARQGHTGDHVRYIFAISLGVAFVLMLAIIFFVAV